MHTSFIHILLMVGFYNITTTQLEFCMKLLYATYEVFNAVTFHQQSSGFWHHIVWQVGRKISCLQCLQLQGWIQQSSLNGSKEEAMYQFVIWRNMIHCKFCNNMPCCLVHNYQHITVSHPLHLQELCSLRLHGVTLWTITAVRSSGFI